MKEAKTQKRSAVRYCGAKNHAGKKCKRTVAKGHIRCCYHLSKKPDEEKVPAAIAAARPGNQNAKSHGIYAATYTEEELGILPELAVDSLDDEIRVAKIQLRRALIVQRDIASAPMDTTNLAGFILAEVSQDRRTSRVDTTRDGQTETRATQHDYSKLLRRRVDTDKIIDSLLGRLAFLSRTRAELVGNLAGAQSAAELAREVADLLTQMESSVAGCEAPAADQEDDAAC